MADKIITIKEPTRNTPGISLTIKIADDGRPGVIVSYAAPGASPKQATPDDVATFMSTLSTDEQAAVNKAQDLFVAWYWSQVLAEPSTL